MRRRSLLQSSLATVLAAPAIAHAQEVWRSSKATYRLVTLAKGLEQPWGMAFLPDGRLLITERPGRLRLFADGRLEPRPLGGTPTVLASGQAGLLDVRLHPDFERNRLIYLSYVGTGRGGSATMVARGELAENGLRGLMTIFQALPFASGTANLGSRLLFDRAGFLYATCGDRFQMAEAQNLKSLWGKIVRLNDDGTVPADNPFVGRSDARPEIFTYGNRNPQGITLDFDTSRIWEVEHGPKGGDELNILKSGANYGWPLATRGVNYDGSKITDHASLPGMEDPLRVWVPSISPCGLTLYTGDHFPGWKGSLFTGALSNFALFRLEVSGARYVGEERLLVGALPYIRDVRQGPDGLLYLVTHSDDGGLYRLEPA